jgi:hypothetical protein
MVVTPGIALAGEVDTSEKTSIKVANELRPSLSTTALMAM